MSDVSKLLDRKLKELDRSDRWLAKRINRHPTTVGNWRRGVTEPRAEDLMLLAAALGIPERDLYLELQKGGKETVRETPGTYSLETKKEGVVETPLFPEALALLAGLHQSNGGLTINLSMAKETFIVPESLRHEGMFAVKTDEEFDCDEEYGTVVLWPWEGALGQNKSILFTLNSPERFYIRRVALYESGRFVLIKAFEGNNVIQESDVNILGVVKAKISLE